MQLRKGDRQALLLEEKETTRKPKPKSRPVTHEEIQNTILRLAQYYNMSAEKEYPGDIGVYDVIWKRIATGNPSKVFEVQHRGSLDSAFVKLKHAYDSWNARLFLVTTSVADSRKAYKLLAGSFHEIRPYLTIVTGWEIVDFARAKEQYSKLDNALK